jgi:hypothetical protein
VGGAGGNTLPLPRRRILAARPCEDSGDDDVPAVPATGGRSGQASSSSAARPVDAALPLPPSGAPASPSGDGGHYIRAPRFSNPHWAVEGGWIVFDVAGRSLDGHCGCKAHKNVKNPCRMNRKSYEGRKLPQGRPIGLLLAWLAAGHRRATQTLHCHMAKERHCTADDRELLSHAVRSDLRRKARLRPELDDLFGLERHLRTGEPDEPLLWA